MLTTRALLSLSLALCATAGASASPADYAVPSVDFSQLSGDAGNAYNRELLRALQRDGILALRNVPRYAELRETYLETAAACAVAASADGAEFLLHRKLRDGTNRYTISMESGRKLGDGSASGGDEVLSRCPAYQAAYQQFSAVVEAAVANVGSALDATQEFQVVVEGGAATMLARKLMDESVHLDHFHAYEAVADLDSAARQLREEADVTSDLSLEMHTDNGLMIAMSAPEYFDVSPSGEVSAKQTRSEDAGLLIQTADGEVVAPLLRADELVLMLGSGIDQWIQTSPPLHPVLHGMRYPRGLSYADGSGDEEHHKLLRAWFGKMVLLEPFQVMANTGMTYGEYANQTTRYLLERGDEKEAFAAVACPPHRQLVASDSSCSLKVCTAKSSASSSALTYSCQVTCNHDSTSDAELCDEYCDCEDASESGTTCWMLCVANLDSDVCPGTQQCNDAYTEDTLAMECVGGTVAPSASASSASADTSASGSAETSTSTPTSTSTSTTATPAPAAGSTSAASSTGTVTPSDDVGDDSTSSSQMSVNSATDSSSSSSSATPTPTPTSGASAVFAAAGSVLAASAALAIAAQ